MEVVAADAGIFGPLAIRDLSRVVKHQESAAEMLSLGVIESEKVKQILRGTFAQIARALSASDVERACKLMKVIVSIARLHGDRLAADRPQLHGHIHRYEQVDTGRHRLSEITSRLGLAHMAERYSG